ncbi:MAG: hypothetical protein GX638_10820, partial [Crenarchaeota archaeon]|nr:hypothetical protein [Thermoproteota archaeon]
IITGTKREYTVLMSGWEAVAFVKPLAVTATTTLKSLFGNYATYYDWKNPESIANAIEKITTTKPNMEAHKKLEKQTIESFNRLSEKIKELF